MKMKVKQHRYQILEVPPPSNPLRLFVVHEYLNNPQFQSWVGDKEQLETLIRKIHLIIKRGKLAVTVEDSNLCAKLKQLGLLPHDGSCIRGIFLQDLYAFLSKQPKYGYYIRYYIRQTRSLALSESAKCLLLKEYSELFFPQELAKKIVDYCYASLEKKPPYKNVLMEYSIISLSVLGLLEIGNLVKTLFGIDVVWRNTEPKKYTILGIKREVKQKKLNMGLYIQKLNMLSIRNITSSW